MPGYIDFKKLAESIDIAEVASLLGIMVKMRGKELRGRCPACKTDDERALQILPETNSYRCYAAGVSGDCISLHGHVKGIGMYKAAKELQEQFGTAYAARTAPATAPQEPEGRTQPAPQAAGFDPAAFAERLSYTEEVKALGISEQDAQRLGIGFHSRPGLMRGRVCFPIRNEDGSIAGFIGVQGSDVKVPKVWQQSNVVSLKRRA